MLYAIRQLSIPSILFIFGFGAIFASLIQKNNNFMDTRLIFKQHFSVFKGSKFACFVIFVVPAILSSSVTMVHTIDKETVSNLNVVLSILTSLFFAMLSILCSLLGTLKDNPSQEETCSKRTKYKDLLKDTFNSVLFECIVCVLLLLVNFSQLFFDNFASSVWLYAISGIIYYLTFVVILNIFVIVKRIRILFNNAFDN